MSKQQRRLTVYMLFIKHKLSDEVFKSQHKNATNKELMSFAVQQWREVSDTQKEEWKSIYNGKLQYEEDPCVILKTLFNTDQKYTISNCVQSKPKCVLFGDLEEEEPLIRKFDSMKIK